MNKYIRKNNGVTLIELLIVLAIMGFALPLAVNFFLLGTNVFSRGESQSIVQQNVRMASMYINTELRNAQSVEIFDSLPSTLEPEINYIYVDGATIKHVQTDLSINVNVINELSVGFTPEIIFNISSNDNKLVNYYIGAVDTNPTFERDFSITSEVKPMNIDDADMIQGTSGGNVIAYTNPLNDNEIVRVDRLNLDIKKSNPFLQLESDGSHTLPIPSTPEFAPNQLYLPTEGKYGSTITWSSDSVYVNPTSGLVYRSRTSNISVTLTATLSKGSATPLSKTFDITINQLAPLQFTDVTFSNAQVGEEFVAELTATGGNPGYVFTPYDQVALDQLTALNMSLSPSGILVGTPLTSGSFSFQVNIEDSHIDTNDNPDTISITGTVTINVSE